MSLKDKSITELRGILSATGGRVNFGDSKDILIDKIGRRLAEDKPKPPPPNTEPPDDHRLRTVPPSRNLEQEALTEALRPFIERGLHLSFPESGVWKMQFLKKIDSGSMRQSLRVIVNCAKDLMR